MAGNTANCIALEMAALNAQIAHFTVQVGKDAGERVVGIDVADGVSATVVIAPKRQQRGDIADRIPVFPVGKRQIRSLREIASPEGFPRIDNIPKLAQVVQRVNKVRVNKRAGTPEHARHIRGKCGGKARQQRRHQDEKKRTRRV